MSSTIPPNAVPTATPTVAPEDESRYGYTPTLYVCIIFVSLFGLSTIIHVGQAIRYKLWWLFPTAVLAGLGECLGWGGRLWSSDDPSRLEPFLMQITTTIIAPTPLVAANFVILGKIIDILGRQYSRLTAKWYIIVFCVFDIIALVVQSVGGASASSAAQEDKDASTGGNIMLGGIVFQLFAITLYVVLAAEFFLRYFINKPFHREVALASSADASVTSSMVEKEEVAIRGDRLNTKLKLMIAGLAFSTLVIFIRSVYRTIELADGWEGRIINTEVYFNVLDGAMILLAMFTLNIFHPAYLLQ